MKNNLNQFVPSEVCLKCDGCCRFKEENSAWQPKMAKEEMVQLKLRHSEERSDEESHEILRFAQNDRKKGLADLILSKETFSKEGVIKTVSCHGEHLCSFFNPQDHTCRVYRSRPFECELYPFVLTRKEGRMAVYAHLMCPFIQEKRSTRDFDDYVLYLKKFFQEQEALAFLKRNPDLAGDYSAYQEELEYLFTLPF